jgi:polygalacturonase
MLAARGKTKRRVETRNNSRCAHFQNSVRDLAEEEKMESDILNTRDCGVTPGVGYGETNRIALQRSVDEMRGAGGGTIYIPTGVYEIERRESRL